MPSNQWGTHTLYVRAVDNAGNTQPAATAYSFYAPWNPTAKVTAGDLDGDGTPDLLATATDGNLTLIGGNTDPSTTPATVSTPAQSPESDGWDKYLIAHRGSIVGQDKDDLFAYQKQTHKLYVYKNDATATPPGTAGHFTLAADVQGPLHRSACVATAAGNCSGYNAADWSSVTQMVAPGTLSTDAYNAAHPTQKVGPAADLITVENGKLWYHISGADPSSYFDTAYQIGTGDWNITALIGIGNVGAVVAGTTSSGGIPTLWVRDDTTGAIRSYPLSFDTYGIPTSSLPAPTHQPLVSTLKSAAGKQMCLDVNQGDTDGSAAQVAECNGSDPQAVTLGTDNTIRLLGKCLDVNGAGTAKGTAVQLRQCNQDVGQQWLPGGTTGSLVNPHSGLCLDATGTNPQPGAPLELWDCNSGANQNWTGTGLLPATQQILPPSLGARSYPAVTTPGDVNGDGNPELYGIGPDGRITNRPGTPLPTTQVTDRWKLADTTDSARTNNLTLNGGATLGTDNGR
ncbi:ricin-type beta-trefoil lectin domain protein, partial [Kitasatospora sp. NPDC004272]